MKPVDPPDLVIDLQRHIDEGRLWKVRVLLPMDDPNVVADDVPLSLDVEVHVIAPDVHLAQYIASTLVKGGIEFNVNDDEVLDDSDLVTSSGV